VILVRHAMPELDPAVPHHEWRLGEAGRAAARELAVRLPRDASVVASDEPKARETAEEIAGGPVHLEPGLREVERPAAWRADYRDLARRYVAGESLEGWEPHDVVVARFAAAAEGAEVVVTHGLAMTLWLAAEGLVEDRVTFWEQIRFPDAWSALAGHLRRVH
jgi:broad specificity phosphatase PhoE